jgi:uncharacterized protein YacL
MFQLCAPALIYMIFSVTQIIIDIFKGLYNTALFKCVIMIMITLLLNALCQQGLSIISWFIVFVPFILMSVIVTILLYVFGLDVATGKLNANCQNTLASNLNTQTTTLLDIFNPNNSNTNLETQSEATIIPPSSSSSPEYIS